jgi:Ca-activated chloride channel family protein
MRGHLRPTIIVGLALGLTLVALVSSAEVRVEILSPRTVDFAVGKVTVEALVVSDERIIEVELLVDNRSMGILLSPPFRFKIDLGADGAAHRFEVVARCASGLEASDLVETTALPIGGEVTIELQQLYVTVTDDQQRVLDLGVNDFTIDDDGDRQDITTFARGDIPFTATLLIDASTSMYGERLRSAYAGANAFVQGMRELDEAKVITFSDRILGISPFTNDKQVLATELSGTLAQGGTAINDHLFMALKLLEQRQGRRVVILLSDGVDSHSVLSPDGVIQKARQSQVLIYWIRLARRFSSADPNESEAPRLTSMWRSSSEYIEQSKLLEQTVVDSGGYIAPITSLDQIKPVFEEILRDLREQYVIAYYPSNERNDGRYHSVRVRVRGSGYEVRAPKGYVDL